MPELPDVQVFKEYFDATSLHHVIREVHFRDVDELLDDVSRTTLRRHLEGGALRSTRRHGKHLFSRLEGGRWLRLHFGMTGSLRYFKTSSSVAPEYSKLRLVFDNGFQLAYVNARKLGAVGLVSDVDAWVEEAGLGPDALGLSRESLGRRLEGRRGGVKSTLMNQEVAAGIGNVYADEILFRCGIHPRRKIPDLDEKGIDSLHQGMKEVFQKAIDGRVETFPDDFLIQRREEGADCPRCGGRIEKATVAGRSTYFCSRHQALDS